MLALLVEIGELTNEWRGFKYWSQNNQPRTTSPCNHCDGSGAYPAFTSKCHLCKGSGLSTKNPLLEEFVDCLHFLLSIGNTLGFQHVNLQQQPAQDNATIAFLHLFQQTNNMVTDITDGQPIEQQFKRYTDAFNMLIRIGEQHLNYSWEDIYNAYLRKNQINHERQRTGY